MPTLREYLDILLIQADDLLKGNELERRKLLEHRQSIVDALSELPQEPVEPEVPATPIPIINDIVVSSDRTLIQVVWEGAADEHLFEITGENGSQTAPDKESPLNISVNGQGPLKDALGVHNGKFWGKLEVKAWGINEGVQSEFATKSINITETNPTTPEVPEVPVTPEVPNIFPFPLQKRGETPKFVRKPDELIDITDLVGGSHKVPNHPTRRALDLSGRYFIGGSLRTIVDLSERKAIFTFSGINAVTWSAVQDGVAWGINSEAIWRYENRRITRYIEPKDLGFRSFSVEAEGEFIDGFDRYAWLKADNAFLIRVDLREGV